MNPRISKLVEEIQNLLITDDNSFSNLLEIFNDAFSAFEAAAIEEAKAKEEENGKAEEIEDNQTQDNFISMIQLVLTQFPDLDVPEKYILNKNSAVQKLYNLIDEINRKAPQALNSDNPYLQPSPMGGFDFSQDTTSNAKENLEREFERAMEELKRLLPTFKTTFQLGQQLDYCLKSALTTLKNSENPLISDAAEKILSIIEQYNSIKVPTYTGQIFPPSQLESSLMEQITGALYSDQIGNALWQAAQGLVAEQQTQKNAEPPEEKDPEVLAALKFSLQGDTAKRERDEGEEQGASPKRMSH